MKKFLFLSGGGEVTGTPFGGGIVLSLSGGGGTV